MASVADVIRALEDGYVLLQLITYDDGPEPYYLKRPDQKAEQVSRQVAEATLRQVRTTFKQSTNWRIWNLTK